MYLQIDSGTVKAYISKIDFPLQLENVLLFSKIYDQPVFDK